MTEALLQRFLLLVAPGRVNRVLKDTGLFFIVGMGRSGTVSLYRLLDRAPGCSVYHETGRDRNALVDAYWHPEKAHDYLAGYRARLIAARMIRDRNPIYGEVNSYLRYHVEALQVRWHPTILHLVRDGRAVVTSLMNRSAFTAADMDHTGRLGPRAGNAFASEWSQMDRFSRVCWYWAAANRYLMDRQLPLVRFEDVITSFDQFSEHLLHPLGIDVPFAVWREQVSQPHNVSKSRRFPRWEDWSPEQKRKFKAICGAVMTDLGYAV